MCINSLGSGIGESEINYEFLIAINDQRPDSEQRYMLEHWSQLVEVTVSVNQVSRNKKLQWGAVTFLAIYAYYTQLLSLVDKILYKGEDKFDTMHAIVRSESVAPPIINLCAGWRYLNRFTIPAPSVTRKRLRYSLNRGLGVPHSWSGRFDGEK
jgi:hypothetical protein